MTTGRPSEEELQAEKTPRLRPPPRPRRARSPTYRRTTPAARCRSSTVCLVLKPRIGLEMRLVRLDGRDQRPIPLEHKNAAIWSLPLKKCRSPGAVPSHSATSRNSRIIGTICRKHQSATVFPADKFAEGPGIGPCSSSLSRCQDLGNGQGSRSPLRRVIPSVQGENRSCSRAHKAAITSVQANGGEKRLGSRLGEPHGSGEDVALSSQRCVMLAWEQRLLPRQYIGLTPQFVLRKGPSQRRLRRPLRSEETWRDPSRLLPPPKPRSRRSSPPTRFACRSCPRCRLRWAQRRSRPRRPCGSSVNTWTGSSTRRTPLTWSLGGLG